MKWLFLSDVVPTDSDQLKTILSQNRGIDKNNAADFFEPKSPSSLTPTEVGFDLVQLEAAVALLLQAIEEKWPMLVYGDYDADGISATAIVWRVLYQLGAEVLPFIPHRERHGYGLSDVALDEILASDPPPRLILTVDNGIIAHAPVQRLVELGVKVIVTDHHQPESELPAADALVHSTQLCGATVGWMLMQHLVKHVVASKDVQKQLPLRTPATQLNKVLIDQLDLTAIATIADQMPLSVGPSRSFAIHGLEALRGTSRPGLLALFTQADVAQSQISAYTVNYTIAPRINAMGRLEDATDALRLLCTVDHTQAQELARLLGNTNSDRQQLTQELLELAESLAGDVSSQHLVIVSSDQFHEGVVGLLAGRLVEKFGLPAIVLSLRSDFAKASARSVPGVNIVELIRMVQDQLLAVGGHPMAAGFSVSHQNLELVTQQLQQLALKHISPQQLLPALELECELPMALLQPQTLATIETFEPFGKQNPKPIFGIMGASLLEVRKLGRDSQHLKLLLRDPDSGQSVEALWWGTGDRAHDFIPGQKLDIAGSLSSHSWNGRVRVQLTVHGVRG